MEKWERDKVKVVSTEKEFTWDNSECLDRKGLISDLTCQSVSCFLQKEE